MEAFLKAKGLNALSTEINAIISKKDDRVLMVRSADPVPPAEIERIFKEEAPRMIWLAIHSGEFFKAFAIDSHFDLGMKTTLLRCAMKSMNEEAIHLLAACNQSIHVESLDALRIVLNAKPLHLDYALQFPEDPVLSRMPPIHIPLAHDGIPLDDSIKESFTKLLAQSFHDNIPFHFHGLPEELQIIVDEFHDKHICDLSEIPTDGILFLTSLPIRVRNRVDVKLPEGEVTCRRLATILPSSHQWLIDRLIIQADTLLETWLNEHSGPDLLFLFNSHFYGNKDDLKLHASRLHVLSRFSNALPVKDDLLSKFFQSQE